jgi:Undecaprenyl-phosphate glucose phosphotransferase
MNFAKPVSASNAQSLPGLLQSQQRKWGIPHWAIGPTAMVIDTLVIFLAAVGGGIAYHQFVLGEPGNFLQFSGIASIVAALFITLGRSNGLYTAARLLSLKAQIPHIASEWIGVFLFLAGVAFSLKAGSDFSRGATVVFAVAGLVGLICTRIVWRILLIDGSLVRQFSGRQVALVTEQSSAVEPLLLAPFALQGLHLVSHFVLPARSNGMRSRKEVIDQVITTVRGSNIEEIILTANLDHWHDLTWLLASLKTLPCPVTLIPAGPVSDLFRLPLHKIGDTVTIELQHGPLTLLDRFLKRIIDIAISGTALILFLPLLLMTAIAIKLDSPGPVIFKQGRRGFNGRPFQILKFRTMLVQEDGERVECAKHNDPRVTRIGSLLRRTSIDELLQLFNVLQGHMSIVGPRPHAVAHDNQFDKMVGNYAYRQHVKPGITGWAQVNGHRGSMATVADVEQRVKFDLWYIDNWSIALDIKILVITAVEVLRGENAY